MSNPVLEVGKFYWAWPVADPDAEDPWTYDFQPARYAGKDKDGNDLWHCLGFEGVSDWPMRWVGEEIKREGK